MHNSISVKQQYATAIETNQYRVGAESNDNPANAYGNKYYMAAPLYTYSEEPNTDGKHWHFGEDGMPELWTDTAAA